MHLLFTGLPLPSHLRMFTLLAQAALARGHRVTAALHAQAHDRLASYGIEVVDAGADLTSLGGAAITPEAFAGPVAQANADAYLPLFERLRPDLILREDTEFGGYLAAERLGIPHACIGSSGAANTLDPGWLNPRIDEHRARLGLPPDPDGAALYRYRLIDYVPPGYGFAKYPIPATRAYRFPLPSHTGEALPEWFAGLPADRPLVVAATGTFSWRSAPALIRGTVDALADLKCSAVIVAKTSIATLPGHVRIVDYLPQPLALQTADLFITQGGMNSIREALQCGVPMVLAPLGADQPHNAERAAELGLGVAIDPATATAARIREACAQVLEDEGYRRRVTRARRAFLTLPDLEAAVDDLEELAR